jgi:hypothetical protein
MEALKQVVVTDMKVGESYPGRFVLARVYDNTCYRRGAVLSIDARDVYGNYIRMDLPNSRLDAVLKRTPHEWYLQLRNPRLAGQAESQTSSTRTLTSFGGASGTRPPRPSSLSTDHTFVPPS